jgi:tRNA pseudouridine38-40 synthase
MRYALGIEYDGSRFNGWQIQRDDPSVQLALENAIRKVANHEASVTGAGRTDTGVHARCQVAHFDSESERTDRQWVLGLNSNLPASVSVRWVRAVSEDFHARFCAVERSYRYTIMNRWVRPALGTSQLTWCRYPLNESLMDEAAQCLLGEHDFSAFRSAGCKANHPVREITRVGVFRQGDEVIFDISANSFLYHMVRNISGTLIDIGKGDRPVNWVSELMEGRDRNRAGMTAGAEGLCFMSARYPDSFNIPSAMEAFPFGGPSS